MSKDWKVIVYMWLLFAGVVAIIAEMVILIPPVLEKEEEEDAHIQIVQEVYKWYFGGGD